MEYEDFTRENGKLTSESMAALIVDALLTSNIIQREHLEKAIVIAMEEIDARKAAGDY